MKKIGIYYGSTTGTTADIARRLGNILNVADADIHDVAQTAPHTVADYDVLVLGSSTWGNGELQDDWYSFVDGLQALDLSDKTIALFGCGDQTMSDTFCNAIGILYQRLRGTGARFIGDFPADVYSFDNSEALNGSTMRGLAIDQVNNPELTDDRLARWAQIIKDNSSQS